MATKSRKIEGGAPNEDDISVLIAKNEAEFTSIDEELDELTKKEADEALVIHEKYAKLRRPIYLKRAAIMKKIPHIWLRSVCLIFLHIILKR